MANNGKKWQGRVLSPARLLPLATVPRVHFTFMRCPLNLNPAPPLRLGLKMRKKPPKNVECAPLPRSLPNRVQSVQSVQSCIIVCVFAQTLSFGSSCLFSTLVPVARQLERRAAGMFLLSKISKNFR